MKYTLLAFCLFILASCAQQNENEASKENTRPLIVCTTGIIGDVVENIIGNEAEVVSLMGAGVDPHLYKATQGDLKKLSDADIILYNGHHLEGKMGEVLNKLGRTKPTIAVTESISKSKLITLEDGELVDPHMWFDVNLWVEVSEGIKDSLFTRYPDIAQKRAEASTAYLSEMRDLDEWVAEQINQIPEAQRVMVTAHDAFSYFGRQYDIEVKGLQGLSTVAEFSLKDVTDMVDFIIERQIPALFVESSVPERSIEAVIEGCEKQGLEVEIGGTLFADAMGEKGTEEGSYIGMIRFNVNTIREALTVSEPTP